MADKIETLRKRMENAARDLDFEEARRLRDMIGIMRDGATLAEAERADFTGLERQKPGAMGLGTSRQRPDQPSGWRPPPKPDPLTSGQSGRRGK